MSLQFQNQMPNQQQQSAFDDSQDQNNSDMNLKKENDNLDYSNQPVISTPVNNQISSHNSDICRDFLRNTCRRGNSCKFNHPESKKNDIPLLTFCHDFQNRECRRNNCKFVHCSKQEEEAYKQTGRLPSTVSNQSLNGNQVVNNNQNSQNNKFNGPKKQFNNNNNNNNNNFQQQQQQQQSNYNNKDQNQDFPVCKDFIKGDCFRGQRCKFRHVKNEQPAGNFINKNFNDNLYNDNNQRFMMQQSRFDPQQTAISLNVKQPNQQLNHQMNRDNTFHMTPIDRRPNNIRQIFEPEAKRRAFDNGYNTPTTFTFANNANSQLCVTPALTHHNQMHNNSTSSSNPVSADPTSSTTAVIAASSFLPAAAAAVVNEMSGSINNSISGSNVSTSSANTITRSMYSNINDNRFLFEENNVLRRQIDELKQQIVELMNANEFLLEQNAQLRNLMPATTVSQTQQLQNAAASLQTSLQNNLQSSLQPTSLQVHSSSVSTSLHNPVSSQLQTNLTTNLQNQRERERVSATSSALNSLSTNTGLSAAPSISSLTTSTSTAHLVSYPMITSSMPHSLTHQLTH